MTGTFPAGTSKLLHRETCRRYKRPGSKLVTPGMLMRGVKVHGPGTRHWRSCCALQQPPEATWRCCNGCTRMAALEMSTRAHSQPEWATWQSCSGRDTMAAAGMKLPAPVQLKEAIWQCYSGLARAAADGMNGRAHTQPKGATWQSCVGARQNGCSWDEITCSRAAAGGHLAVLEWARQSGCRWNERTCSCAAHGGHLTVLQWARKNGCSWDEHTTLFAAWNNHLNVLKWARQQQPSCPWWSHDERELGDCSRKLVDAKPSTLLWLAQQGAPLPDDAYVIACSSANWLTHTFIALRALLPAELLMDIMTLSLD